MWKSPKSKGNFFLFILKSKNFKQFSQSKIANVRHRICGRTDRLITTDSNMTSFFCFVNKRAIYWLGIISLAHAPVHVTDFPVVNVHVQWFPLKPVASYMAFYFLILTGYFFVSYIFYIENFNMIKIKLNLLMHSVPITSVGMIKYLQRNSWMANLACSLFVYFIQWPIMPVVVTKVRCKAFSDWSNKAVIPWFFQYWPIEK